MHVKTFCLKKVNGNDNQFLSSLSCKLNTCISRVAPSSNVAYLKQTEIELIFSYYGGETNDNTKILSG